jgi:ribonuclease PH
VFKPRDHLPGPADKYIEQTLFEAIDETILLSQFPFSEIVVVVQVVVDDGSVLHIILKCIFYILIFYLLITLMCFIFLLTLFSSFDGYFLQLLSVSHLGCVLALLNAGVPMSAMPMMATVAVAPNNRIIVFPNKEEEEVRFFLIFLLVRFLLT